MAKVKALRLDVYSNPSYRSCVYGYWTPPSGPTRREGHGSMRLFREKLDAMADDFAAGLMSVEEFSGLCSDIAREYAGWWER